jgi:hypothetical protein
VPTPEPLDARADEDDEEKEDDDGRDDMVTR